MENHILQLTFCSAAVIDDDSRVSAYNILGERMTLERSSNENDENATDNEINKKTNESPMNILINGKSRMVEADYMATNGVLHVSLSSKNSRMGEVHALDSKILKIINNEDRATCWR